MTEHNMVGQSTAVNQNDKPRDLDKLASIIRLGFEEIQVQLRNALRIGLVMGEALNEAKRQVGNGGWGKWLHGVRTVAVWADRSNRWFTV